MNATEQSIIEQFSVWDQAEMPLKMQGETGVLRVVIGCGTSYNLALAVASVMNRAGIGAIAVPAGEWD